MNHISPKEFESLVADLHRKFAAGSDVQRNVKFLGRKSGALREVDIAITTSIAGEPLLIAVECRRKSRKCDVEEVGSFVSKLDDIGAQKGIMVSALGFTKAAAVLAKANGVSVYRYADTLREDWPSGLETMARIVVWEIFPVGAVIVMTDGSTLDIVSEDEHEFIECASGDNVGLATLMRMLWEQVPEVGRYNGDHFLEHPVSTPENPAVAKLGLRFRTFKHQSIRQGRLQFEGLVDDEAMIAKVMGWKMIFPESEKGNAYQAEECSACALSLMIRTAVVHTDGSDSRGRLEMLLSGHLELVVGFQGMYKFSFH